MSKRKTYKYNGIMIPVNDNDDVIFEVDFISSGNTGYTNIDTPLRAFDAHQIHNSGSEYIGKGKELRGEMCFSFSDIVNLAEEENEIIIDFKINGSTIVRHRNKKSEEHNPYIDIVFYFK